MKNLLLCLFALLPCCIYAQQGYIFTIAGNGTGGYSGDGGLATNANIDTWAGYATGIAVDNYGNVYFTDSNRIRKIDAATGIITAMAGTGVPGYSGDGGPAINAQFHGPARIKFNTAGDLYVADQYNCRIRKINFSTGIVTTVAGTGGTGFSGDGGLAVNAQIDTIISFCLDAASNIYIADGDNNRVRKVSGATGIITTIAGNGTLGFSGDGGPAINAQFYHVGDVALDSYGNIYIADRYNDRIRKIQAASGIITTIAGNGVFGCNLSGIQSNTHEIAQPFALFIDCTDSLYFPGLAPCNWALKMSTVTSIADIFTGYTSSIYSGNGVPAVGAGIDWISDIAVDCAKNIYLVDQNRIRKIVGMGNPAYVTDSFSVYISHYCYGPQLAIIPKHYSPTLTLKTWFGDGQTRTDSLNNNVCAYFDHLYQFSGSYTIKHVLYNGPTPVESVSYPYTYTYCRTLPIRLYTDANNNCIQDSSGDFLNNIVSSVEIDSNGVAIDTVSLTSGYNYNATGNVGDIYQFKVLSTASGYAATCPASGIIADTLILGTNPTKSIGFYCNSSTAFDFANHLVTTCAHPYSQHGWVVVYNSSCMPTNAIETVSFSPKYANVTASPSPALVSGNTITWNFNNLSAILPSYFINYTVTSNGTNMALPGDTVNTTATINPIIGDINPSNNIASTSDIVTNSFDPNDMSVSPSGYIPASSTQLTYTFEFENTGNDTAQNIYVLDTISNYLDIHSLSLVAASHTMITSKVFNGTNWVMKFDFPNIKLLDSSHHNQCTGLAVFTIKTKPGLANGTVIPNRAGIYFDDNPVVLTNTVTDIIGTPSGITQVSAATVAPHIYPNPAHNELHIEGTDIHTVEVTNLLGQVVLSSHNASTTTTLNIESLQSGIYFVRVNGLYPYRLIKE